MPPAKTPKRPVTERQAADVLVRFAKNLEEQKRWYRGATDRGHEVGYVVMQEMILQNVGHALALALEGKAWEAPEHNP